jgi:hypothetical protein
MLIRKDQLLDFPYWDGMPAIRQRTFHRSTVSDSAGKR